MLTQEQKTQFDEILESLGDSLDITETQFETAVKSYRAVGDWLSQPESLLAPYKPLVRPQGSFMIGTMIKPVNEEDELDLDLVCELTGKNPSWTQYDLKHKVGNRIKEHGTYKDMLKQEGRRCWTLKYAESSSFHMDILPALVCHGYNTVLEKAFSASLSATPDYEKLAIRITDKLQFNYRNETNADLWMKSNPFGYGQWFLRRASLGERKIVMLSESVKPVPSYQKEKLPLQRVVQILKRHRDIMFNGDEHKPISIIITTLAAKAYQGEPSVIDALNTVIAHMKDHITEKYDPVARRMVKVISNPVNPEENFADKWIEHPQRETNFFNWLDAVRNDVYLMTQQRGIHIIGESMKKTFGEQTITKAFSSLADKARISRESGSLKMAATTGILGTAGAVTAKTHNFHGKD